MTPFLGQCRRLCRLALVLGFLTCCCPVRAQPEAVLILFDGLAPDDLAPSRAGALQLLVTRGAVGLMNTATGPGPRPIAAVMAMASGSLAPAEPTDALAFEPAERVEGDPAAVVYERRTGIRAPAWAQALHLGIASLTRRHLQKTLPNALTSRSRAVPAIAVCGNADTSAPSRPVALFGMDELGVVRHACIGRECLLPARGMPWGVRDRVSLLLQKISGWHGMVVVVQIGDAARSEASRPLVGPMTCRKAHDAALKTLNELVTGLQRLPAPPHRIAVVSPEVPGQSSGSRDRLALAVFCGKGIRPGLLTSATTRTRGLIANVDVAPTLLHWLGLPAPVTMTGHVVYSVPASDAVGEVRRLDRRTQLNQRVLLPLFLLLGGVLALCLFGAALVLAGYLPALPVRLGVLALMNMPLALMLAAAIPLAGTGHLIGACLLLMGTLALAEDGAGRILKQDVLAVFAGVTGAAISLDTLFGLGMIRFSVLSGYQIQGIRYYGIGNEYMGVLVGVALLLCFLWQGKPAARIGMLAGIALLLGLPWWGENAGGFVTAVVALGAVWRGGKGKHLGIWGAIGWSVAGLVGALVLAELDRAISGSSAGHMGAALAATQQAGCSYAAKIAWRKVAMNLRISTQPYTVAALVGAGLMVGYARGILRPRLERLAQAHARWWEMRVPCFWSGLAALVFNDSGIVAALFILAAFLLSGLYYALQDQGITQIEGKGQIARAP